MTTPMPLVWCAPIYEATGYADEARGMVVALEAAGIPVVLRPVAERQIPEFHTQLSPSVAATLDRQAQRLVKPPFLLVEHFVADGFVPTEAAAAVVGRTMFETDALPPAWVAGCNALDALWVPSQFNVESFRRAGVHIPIDVVPGGVDSSRYTPEGPCYPIAGLRRTVFLSVFEWRQRKGWDVLLRAWAEAFDADADVSLVLRTYVPGFGASAESAVWLEHAVSTFLVESCGRHRDSVAPIVLIPELVAEQDMPALYRAAHAYVSPTRGEGWGRPLMEAMATGLPVIATRWSGHLEYMTDDNSLLLDVDGLVAATDPDALVYRETAWAEPSVSHLVALLQRVCDDRDGARAIGQQARQDMVTQWTWERAAEVIAQRVDALQGTCRAAYAARTSADMQQDAIARVLLVSSAFSSSETPLELTALLAPLSNATEKAHISLRVLATPRDERPSVASPLFTLWRDRATLMPLHASANDMMLTWCTAQPFDEIVVPPEATWVVCTGDAVLDRVPDWLAAPLRERPYEIWVPHRAAYLAVRSLGVPAERVFQIPAMSVLGAQQVRAMCSTAGVELYPRRRVLLPVSTSDDVAAAELTVRLWPRVSGAAADLAIRIDQDASDVVHEWGATMGQRTRTLRGLESVSVLNAGFGRANIPSLLRRADVLLTPRVAPLTQTWWRVARDLGCALIAPDHPMLADFPDAGVWRVTPGANGALSGATLAMALTAACTTDALVEHRAAMRNSGAHLNTPGDVAALLVSRLVAFASARGGVSP